MTRLRIAALLAALLAAAPATAQTSPNFTFGQVPTVAQWNALFAAKQDWLGAPPLLTTGGTLTGPLVTAASITASAGLNLPPGTAPTSPFDGDLWTTTAGLYVRINGSTIGPLGTAACPTCAVTNATNVFTARQSVSLNSAPTSPVLAGAVLQLQGATGGIARLEVDAVGNVGALSCIRSDGTTAAPTAVQSGEEICTLNGGGYDGSTFTSGSARVSIFAAQNWAPGAHGSRIVFSTTTSNTTTRTDGLALENDGGVTLNGVASQGTGTLNLPNGIYNNGVAPVGTGGYVRATFPTLVNPILGTATGTSLALNGCTIGASAFCASGQVVITSSSGNALTVGRNGTTNPSLLVDASQALSATGLDIQAGAAGNGLSLSVISPNTNESVSFNAKGAGTISIGGTSTGAVSLGAGGGGVAAFTLAGGITAAGNNITGVGTFGATTINAFALGGGVTAGGNNITGVGALTATTFNGNTLTTGTWTLNGAAAKGFTFSSSMTLAAGADSQTFTFPSTSATIARTDAGQTFTGTQTFGTIAATTINAFTLGGGITGAGNNISGVGVLSLNTPLALSSGGSNNSLTASNGGVVYSDASKLNILAGTVTAGQCLLSQTSSAPIWGSCAGGASVLSIAGNTGAFTLGGLLTNNTNLLQVVAAAKSDQQTGTSATLAVTPSQQQSHDSAAKAWINFVGVNGNVNSTAYNVTGNATRNSTGNYTITFTTAFANANYVCHVQPLGTVGVGYVSSQSTGSATMQTVNLSGTNIDPTNVTVECFGRQ